ncbi:L,D-transpeptidase [Streptomyces longwoodensis]|uniref:L,D-transpeptidase n=1 Tax=Streptomyces longwoodensis TaxID=68231 RepID=UPI0033E03B7F
MQHSREGFSMPAEPRPRRRRLAYTALTAAGLITLAACSQSAKPASAKDDAEPGGSSGAEPSAAVVSLSPAVKGEKVIADEPLVITARGGKLASVTVAGPGGATLDGKVAADGGSWTSAQHTRYSTTYTLKAQLTSADGSKVSRSSTFTTVSKDEIFVGTYNVRQGSSVGVALPVSVVFNKPVHDKAAVERGLSVTSAPAVEGSWSWMKDRDGKDRVDYRPKGYWKPGTKVTFGMDLVGVKNGDLVGTQKRRIAFTVGTARTATVDVVSKTLTYRENGKVVRSIPVSTGKETFETWNGTMVVLSKVPTIRMNSATVGIFGPEAYDLGEVKWDVQLTPSGTYIHAAPWNEGKFGRVNSSHGCIGMSTEDAGWLYQRLDYGDPVTVVKSKDTVASNNGYGGWNVAWEAWKKGSALA